MGPLLTRALERAGLSEIAAHALAGHVLTPHELSVLNDTDVLLIGGLADAVRARHRGTAVKVWSLSPSLSSVPTQTGAEILSEVAFSRLSSPVSRGVRVSCDALGVQVALVALAYGADELEVARPSLTRPDSFAAIARMIEAAGKTVVRGEAVVENREVGA